MEFNYRLRRSSKTTLERIRGIMPDNALIAGTARRGWFAGPIEGNYEIVGNEIRIVVRRKPHAVAWSTVEQGLKQLVA